MVIISSGNVFVFVIELLDGLTFNIKSVPVDRLQCYSRWCCRIAYDWYLNLVTSFPSPVNTYNTQINRIRIVAYLWMIIYTSTVYRNMAVWIRVYSGYTRWNNARNQYNHNMSYVVICLCQYTRYIYGGIYSIRYMLVYFLSHFI